ncbi:hypothetical protein D3C86_1905820 [compost metagenome]
MDSGDKATNKAMSAAYKYAAFQAFCIPTEGDNDADGQTHQVASANDSGHSEPTEADAMIVAQMNAAATVPDLVKLMNGLAADQKRLVTQHFNQRMSELKKAA